MYLLRYKKTEASDGCSSHKSQTAMFFSADTNTKVSEVWKLAENTFIYTVTFYG